MSKSKYYHFNHYHGDIDGAGEITAFNTKEEALKDINAWLALASTWHYEKDFTNYTMETMKEALRIFKLYEQKIGEDDYIFLGAGLELADDLVLAFIEKTIKQNIEDCLLEESLDENAKEIMQTKFTEIYVLSILFSGDLVSLTFETQEEALDFFDKYKDSPVVDGMEVYKTAACFDGQWSYILAIMNGWTGDTYENHTAIAKAGSFEQAKTEKFPR